MIAASSNPSSGPRTLAGTNALIDALPEGQRRARQIPPSADYSDIVKEKGKEEKGKEEKGKEKGEGRERKAKRKREEDRDDEGEEVPTFLDWVGKIKKSSPTIFLSFDGACRGNQSAERQASYACCMWIEGGEETPLLFGHREERLGGDRPTNNKAELRAAILAAQFAQEVAEKMSRSIDVSIRGDSMYVVNGIIDGRLSTTTKEKSEQVNWEEWNDLRRAIREATKVNFFWKWVPRCLNRAADACANAVLDNTTINDGDWALAVPHAPPGLSIPDEKLLSYWSCTERTACKFLSPFMHDAWRKLFYALLQEAMTVDTAPAWFAVIAAPTIYLFPQPKAVQRVFLGRVSEVSEARRVFEETMSVPKVVERRQFAKRSTEESISYLVSGGKSARACELLEEKSVSVLPATKEDAERTWPNRSEGVLRFDDTTAMDINFAQVVAAARGMRNGRAADLGGWTKELFMVLLREASDFEKMQIEHFFMRIGRA